MVERGDAYERLKAMQWLRDNNYSFSNHPFLDHRARIYERGFIGPQSGETFRPFLNTIEEKPLGVLGFKNLQDQIGGYLGGLSDNLEGNHNSLSVLGRQQIAMQHRNTLVELGNLMRRGKPNDIRKILESKFMAEIDGEDQGKALRLALEMSKIDEFLGGDYSAASLAKLENYKTALALEQDASSSGAQIIALTTKNKQLAEFSNVIPTNQKQRLYDEVARATFNDPRFLQLNKRLGLTEKDLRRAAKQNNMVRLYGAGERTGVIAVESKLSKALGKEEGTLVVKAVDRDKILAEISARMARYEKFDPDTYNELKALRQDVKDIFNKGLPPGDDLMEQLFFLDNKTRDLVEKMSRHYEKVVTPDDFKAIALIMNDHMAANMPILSSYTKFMGRLAEDFVINAKPDMSMLDKITQSIKIDALGKQKDKPPEILKRIPGWKPGGALSELLFGVREKKLPKSWTNVPAVNFDKKILEQHFTQTFEERLNYKDKDGNWVTNIIQVPQKTDPTWWEEFIGKEGKINDIVDASKARTAYGVNANHSNDGTLVKNFHIWGKKNNIATSTVNLAVLKLG